MPTLIEEVERFRAMSVSQQDAEMFDALCQIDVATGGSISPISKREFEKFVPIKRKAFTWRKLLDISDNTFGGGGPGGGPAAWATITGKPLAIQVIDALTGTLNLNTIVLQLKNTLIHGSASIDGLLVLQTLGGAAGIGLDETASAGFIGDIRFQLGTPGVPTLGVVAPGGGSYIDFTNGKIKNYQVVGVLTLPDDVRQTFNPGISSAGVNVGQHPGDPNTPVNGDLWYNSTTNALNARIGGANVQLGLNAPGGPGSFSTLTCSGAFTPGSTINLAENGPIVLDPSLSAIDKYSGTIDTGTSGESLTFGQIVYLKSDGLWWRARADTVNTSGPVMLGMVAQTVLNGVPFPVLLMGKAKATVFPTPMTPGAALFVSAATLGSVTHTAPSSVDAVTRVVGYALTTTEAYFHPSNDWITHT